MGNPGSVNAGSTPAIPFIVLDRKGLKLKPEKRPDRCRSLSEEEEERRYLAQLKREYYSDFYQLMEEYDTDYNYREED